jgi:F-type H+-transporting ATPase subunit a
MASGSNPLSHVVQHPILTREADLGPLTPNGEITLLSDHITMIIAAGLLLTLFLPPLFRRRKTDDDSLEGMVPKGFANGMEAICQYLREEVAAPALGPHTDRFIKYIWSTFFFILTINLLGLLPIAPITGLFGLHIGGTATSNIWVTGTFAITTLFMMVFNGLRLGGKDFIAHLCPGPLWLAPILVPVELMGMLAKTFALAVRLFANMVAGHTLLAVLLGFILSAGSAGGAGLGLAVAVPVVLGSVGISLLEIFVAFLQAFIFTFLTTLFIGMSVSFHHDEHHEEVHV